MKKIVAMLVLMVMVMLVPMNAFAASKIVTRTRNSQPRSGGGTKETVVTTTVVKKIQGKKIIIKKIIKTVVSEKASDGFLESEETTVKTLTITAGKNSKITKKQFLRLLKDLYGSKAPKGKNPKGYATENYAIKNLVKLAKNIGISIWWKGRSRKITWTEAWKLIKIFADYDSAFKPH